MYTHTAKRIACIDIATGICTAWNAVYGPFSWPGVGSAGPEISELGAVLLDMLAQHRDQGSYGCQPVGYAL